MQQLADEKLGQLKLAPRRAQSEMAHGHDQPLYYIQGWLEWSQTEFWIYENEAMLMRGLSEESFEKADYDSDDDLIACFVRRLLEPSAKG